MISTLRIAVASPASLMRRVVLGPSLYDRPIDPWSTILPVCRPRVHAILGVRAPHVGAIPTAATG
jgi:hypothetical protein